eukprot:s1905_g2.t1
MFAYHSYHSICNSKCRVFRTAKANVEPSSLKGASKQQICCRRRCFGRLLADCSIGVCGRKARNLAAGNLVKDD